MCQEAASNQSQPPVPFPATMHQLCCVQSLKLILHRLPPFQAPGDPELSLYDSEEDIPSYWDLEQVS